MNPIRTGLFVSGLAPVALTVTCSSGGTSRTAAALSMQNRFAGIVSTCASCHAELEIR